MIAWDKAWRTWRRTAHWMEWQDYQCLGLSIFIHSSPNSAILRNVCLHSCNERARFSRTGLVVGWIGCTGTEWRRYWNRCLSTRTFPSPFTAFPREQKRPWSMNPTDSPRQDQELYFDALFVFYSHPIFYSVRCRKIAWNKCCNNSIMMVCICFRWQKIRRAFVRLSSSFLLPPNIRPHLLVDEHTGTQSPNLPFVHRLQCWFSKHWAAGVVVWLESAWCVHYATIPGWSIDHWAPMQLSTIYKRRRGTWHRIQSSIFSKTREPFGQSVIPLNDIILFKVC